MDIKYTFLHVAYITYVAAAAPCSNVHCSIQSLYDGILNAFVSCGRLERTASSTEVQYSNQLCTASARRL